MQRNKIDFVTLPVKTLEQEAALCLFIAEHASFAQVDHLGNLCVKYFEGDNSAARMRLHRTKCTNIIKNVLGLHFSEELRSDIGDSKFSLQIDESTDISVTKLLENIEEYVHEDLNKGYEFEKHIKLIKLDPSSEKEIRDCCSTFLVELIKQLKQRLPDNYNTLKQDSGGNNTFAELAKVAIDLLSLPWSNAEVERIFSQVNLVKSKLRNKLHLSTLNSVLYIRYGLRRLDQCCHSYKVPNKFLRMIGTRLSYENENQENGDNIDEIIHCL
ncbi:hypothetical protein ACLKA6_018412 [Drosophila palustris]